MFHIVQSGDESLTVYLAREPGDAALQRVMAFVNLATAELSHWLVDLVPSYCCVALYFDLLRCDFDELLSALGRFAERLPNGVAGCGDAGECSSHAVNERRRVELPVYYGAEVAPDLERVTKLTGLSSEHIIQLHSAQEYRVYALGFRPGFAFMGEAPAALQLPRLESPRAKVAAGSLAIAEAQTAIYPSASPGGWNLIGRCPIALFRLEQGEPRVHLQVGDAVRFIPVTRTQFLSLGGQLHG